MKNYKITLSTTELQKLSIFLVMYEDKLIESSEAYKQLATEYENFSPNTLQKFRSNSQWYKETYEIIKSIREQLDAIPF